jgi:hypothetical protein
MSREVMKSCLLLLLVVGLCCGQFSATGGTTNSVDELQKRIQILTAENEALRKENESLRKLAPGAGKDFLRMPAGSGTVEQRPNLTGPSATAAAQKRYWLTTSSGKRHNSGCRYFETSKGRACNSSDGVACKACGG